MKALLYVASSAAVLIGALLVYGITLDSEWRVERSTLVDASSPEVFIYATTLSNFPEWTVWNKDNYPEMEIAFSGPPIGVGAVQAWDDGSMPGTLEVIDYKIPSRMGYQVSMDGGAFTMDCALSFDADGLAETDVTWSCQGDSGSNPIGKLMMKMYQPMIAKDFEGGLQNLAAKFAD